MANSGPGQNATVEEILASIRQAISEDDARRTVTRGRPEPRSLAERRPTANISEIPGDADDEAPEASGSHEAPDEAEAAPVEPSIDQGVIEMAIEQALDGVRAEMQGRSPAARIRARQELTRPAPRVIPRATVRTPMVRRDAAPVRGALLSPRADAQVSASFDELAKAMIEGNASKVDAVVEDILRPMLKTWLEDNLPQMVERMVREEIERVSRSGRR
jgi:cell pole-organizing protein PopZ